MVQLNFVDLSQVDLPGQMTNNLPLSDQPMLVVATGAEMVPMNDKKGERFVIHCEVIEGENKGARGDISMSLRHSNPETVRIANQQLKAFSTVVGVFHSPQNSAELLNIPFRVTCKKSKDERYRDHEFFTADGLKPHEALNRPAVPQTASQGQPQGWGGQQPQGQPAAGNGGGWGAQPNQPQQQAPQQEQPAQQPAATGTPPWGAPQGQAPAATGAPPWASNGQ